jgi:sulfonate transport system substrate-binding protein
MNATKLESRARVRLRRIGATLFSATMGVAIAASAFAADTVTLRVGDQKGGNRSLLEISGYAKDLPYRIEWSEFPAAAPILEALNAGALDVGYTGDLSFLTVYAAGAPIKAIGGTRSDARRRDLCTAWAGGREDRAGRRLDRCMGGLGALRVLCHAQG